LLQLFTGLRDEWSELEKLCTLWVSESRFWNINLVKDALNKHSVLIHYTKNSALSENWATTSIISKFDGDAELLYLFTLPSERGRGLARKHLRWLVHEVNFIPPLRVITLEVRPSNRKAIAIYRGLGFIEANLRKKYYSDGEDAIVMRLEK